MNPIVKVLALLALFVGWSFGMYRFGVSNQGTKDNLSNTTATLTQTQGARQTEQVLAVTQNSIDAAYQKGVLDGRQKTQILTDSLLSGALGMYVPARPTAPAVPSDPKSKPVVVKETRCQLPGKTAADLARLASDADDIVRQSNSLIDYYEQVLTKLGHPELINKDKP